MRRVSLSATASQEVAHDWLQLRLGTQREGTDAAALQRALGADVEAALGVLRALAQGEQLQVASGPLQLQPRYGKDGRANGWVATAELVVQGRDFGRIAQAAAQAQPLVVQGLQFSLSAAARVALEADLQRQAIERFQAKAQQAAAAFGFAGYELVQVQLGSTDHGGGGVRPLLAARAASAELAAPVPAEPGRTTVQLTVSGTVRLR